MGDNGSHDLSRMIESEGKVYIYSTGGGGKSSPDGLAWTNVHFHGGFYYLWWQTGSCCSGTASTYTMHVARSAAITGPYTGDRRFFASNSSLGINGPGHMGIYACGGVERFTYHYYPTSRSVVGENTLTCGNDGWPVAGPRVTTPSPCPAPLPRPCRSGHRKARKTSASARSEAVSRCSSPRPEMGRHPRFSTPGENGLPFGPSKPDGTASRAETSRPD